MITSTPLLKLLNLASPTLPIGTYSYSQGLEWAIEQGGIDTPEAINNWLQNVLGQSVGMTDIPVLNKLCQAFAAADGQQISYWNHWILACRETRELTNEDKMTGKALLRLLQQQQISSESLNNLPDVSFTSAWAFAADHWKIPIPAASLAYCWSWAENQIAVACKILPLAQTPAQTILMSLMPHIEAAVDTGLKLADEDIGQSLPGWVMASVHHESQYSRLFRS